MSSGLDLSQFYDTFFDEADELLAEMEGLLLELDVDAPDIDHLNAIFRAAHSIKGGAATFGTFEELAETTHLLENILDYIRNDELPLRPEMIDLFLETKDVLSDMVFAYRNAQAPDSEVSESIREQLLNLNKEKGAKHEKPDQQKEYLRIHIKDIKPKNAAALRNEMGIMGDIVHEESSEDSITFWLNTTTAVDDIIAVSCFVVNEEQIETSMQPLPKNNKNLEKQVCKTKAPLDATSQPSTVDSQQKGSLAKAAKKSTKTAQARKRPIRQSESSTLRVGVERVDQIINLVGELVITQAMLVQTASTLDPVVHDRLLNGLEQLERNARDLQERSEEHTSELQSRGQLVCRLLLETKT